MERKNIVKMTWGKWLVKEFTYWGLSKKELEELPLDKLFKLFPARARRSLTRGIDDNKRKLIKEIKAVKAGELKTNIKTHLRDLLILPYMTGVTVNVFSGKEFLPVVITTQMVGHYLGEFVITNKRVNHGAPGVGASRSSLYVPLKWKICQNAISHFNILIQQNMFVLQ